MKTEKAYKEHDYTNDTESFDGEDLVGQLSRFQNKPEWRNSDDDYFSTDNEEDESNDSDDTSIAEEKEDSDTDGRPPTKRKRTN